MNEEATSPAPLLASEDGLVAPLSNSECVFQLRHTGENHVMTFQVLKAMDACRQFRTLDEHVQVVAQTLPELQQQPQAIKQVLENLIKRNLFTSAQAFVDEVFAGTSVQPTAPMAGVMVRTKDRPAHLRSLLDSALALERQFGHARCFLVVDDSRDDAARHENEQLVAAFAEQSLGGARYLGQKWRIALADVLIREFPSRESSIRWLIGPATSTDGFSGGQGWNAALLATAGQRLMMFDDDFLLSARRPDNAATHRVQLLPGAASQYAQFYDSRNEVLESGVPLDGDPLIQHEQLCGTSLAGFLDDMAFELAPDSLNQSDLKSLRQQLSGACIKTTHMGTYGQSGAGTNAWIFLVKPEARAHLWQSEAAYRSAMTEAWVMRGVAQAKISSMGVYAPVAIDNSSLTPFAAPTDRGEDFHFASLMKLLYPNSVDFEVPWMMCHLRPGSATMKKPSALTPPLSRFVADFVSNLRTSCRALDPARRYRYAAAALRDQAAAPNLDRQRTLREYLSHARARLIQQMNQVLTQADGAPDYWTADLKLLVEANGTALLGDAPPKLRGWHRETTGRACADRLSNDLNCHADAMDVWPDLWELGQRSGGSWLDM